MPELAKNRKVEKKPSEKKENAQKKRKTKAKAKA